MALKIDAKLIENVDDPSFDLLNYAITEKMNKLTEYDKLYNYYLGKQLILNRNFGNPAVNDQHVVVNHAKYFTDMITGMMTGNPITYVPQDGNNIDAITEALSKMDIAAHDTDLELQLSIYGVGYELVYLKVVEGAKTEEQIACLDPRYTIVITDDTEEENEIYGIYLQPKKTLKGEDSGYLISVYTPDKLIQYRTRMGYELSEGNIDETTEIKSYWSEEPITEFYNNGQQQGDFEQLIPLIDSYNSLQSDRITDKDNFIDSILLAYGTSVEGNLQKGQMLDDLPSDAKIEWLTKALEENDVQTLSDSIKNDLHEMANVPNMTDKDFAGNISGEAMKYKLFGLLNLISVKEQYLNKGLKRRLKLLAHMIGGVKQQDVDITGVRIQLTPNIPVNLTDTITNIRNADGIIPRQVTFGWLPEGYDPQKLIEMMDEQNAKQIQQNKDAIGEGDPEESTANVNKEDQEGYRDSSTNNEDEK